MKPHSYRPSFTQPDCSLCGKERSSLIHAKEQPDPLQCGCGAEVPRLDIEDHMHAAHGIHFSGLKPEKITQESMDEIWKLRERLKERAK